MDNSGKEPRVYALLRTKHEQFRSANARIVGENGFVQVRA